MTASEGSQSQEGSSSTSTGGDGPQDEAASRSVNPPSADGSSSAESKEAANTVSTPVAPADETLEPPADGPSTSASSQSSLFSRLQSVIPPNLISTVQSHIPESIKHASENIDVSQIGSNVLAELQRVQGVTRAQAEEYARKSEALIREAVKEANEVLKDAVKIIPPDASGQAGSSSGSGLVWDGSDMWMLPTDSFSTTSNQASSGKEKEGGPSSESQHAVASRALALLHRLQSDPSIIQHDPEADEGVKEAYAKWREEEIKSKGGIESPEWTEQTAKLLKEVTPLYELYSSLGKPVSQKVMLPQSSFPLRCKTVPATLSKEDFWSRYFFRAHQIKHEEERRKALIQGK